MSWKITRVVHSRASIFRVTAEEKDAQGALTGEMVSAEYNENEEFSALQSRLLDTIAKKQQEVSDKDSKLTIYQTNVSLASAKSIKGEL